MADGIEIIISAEVQNAIAALEKVQASLLETDKVLNKVSTSTDQSKKINNQAAFALNNFNRVIQDLPFGLRGVANNIDPLIESFNKLRESTKSTGGALAALRASFTGGAALAAGVSIATTVLMTYGDELLKLVGITQQAEEENNKLKDSISGVYGEVAKEATQVTTLISVLNSETETRDKKLAAIKKLQEIQPDVFKNLKLEGEAVVGLDKSYKNYLDRLKTVIAVKILQAQLEAKLEQLLKKQGITLTGNEKLFKDATRALQDSFINDKRLGPEAGRVFAFYDKQRKASQAATDQLVKDVEEIGKKITELSVGVDIDLPDPKDSKEEFERYRRKVIAEAKKIGDATKEFIDLKFYISPFESEQDTFERAKDFLDKFKKNLYKFVPIGGPPVIEFPVGVKPPTAAELKEQLRISELRDLAAILMPTESEAAISETAKSIRDRFIEGLKPKGAKPTDIFGNVITELKTVNDLLKTTEGVSKLNDYIRKIDNLKQAYKDLGLEAPNIELSGPLITLDESIKNAQESLKDLKAESKDAATSMSEDFQILSKVFGDLLNPAFDSFFQAFEEGKNPVQSFFQGFADGVKRLIQEMIKLAALSGIISLASGGKISFGAAFSALSGFGGMRANGGPVSGNTPYLVGERGPELFVPSVSGSIVPNNSVGGFMGGGMGSMGGRSSVLRGQDILLAYARTQRSQLRVNG